MKIVSALFRSFLYCAPVLFAVQARAQIEGTLFTSPEERAYLDYLREEFLRNNAEQGFNIQQVDIPEIPPDVAPEDTGPIEYSFGGIMTRRDGSHSIWLNGALLGEAQLPAGFSLVENNRSMSLQIVQDGKTFTLRPGQTVNLAAGTIVENLQRPQPKPAEAATSATTPVANVRDEDSAAASTMEGAPVGEEAPSQANSGASSEFDTTGTEDAELASNRAASIASALSQMSAEELNQLVEVLQTMQEEDTGDEP